MTAVVIASDGTAITSTTYWSTPNGRHGLLYLSINAGALRLLVPAALSALPADAPPVGTSCEVERVDQGSREIVRLRWLDNPETPYEIEIDARQCDRRLPASDAARVVPLIWYGPGAEPDSVVELRREAVAIASGP